MTRARVHYEARGYAVRDVSQTESYDLLCLQSGQELHVEVKGTTGDPDSVLITANEERHALEYPHVALFIVYGIDLSGRHTASPVASGGRVRALDPWDIKDCHIEMVTARCHLPREPEADGQLPLALTVPVAPR